MLSIIIKTFFKKTTNLVFIVLTILLLIGGIYLGYSYFSARNAAIEAQIEVDRQRQNAAALEDSLNMVARRLQDTKVFINDLQDENTELNKEVAYVKSKFVLLLDSVEVLNQGTTSFNYGDSIIVTFEGKQGRVFYKGHTTYFTVLDTGTYSIKITVDPIEISSYIYLNEEDNLIYNKIYADSVLIDDVYTVVDSALYKKLKMPVKIDINIGFFNRISLFGEYVQPFNVSNELFIKPHVSFGLNYEFKNGFGLRVGRDFLYEEWFVGIRYSLTPAKIFGFIF